MSHWWRSFISIFVITCLHSNSTFSFLPSNVWLSETFDLNLLQKVKGSPLNFVLSVAKITLSLSSRSVSSRLLSFLRSRNCREIEIHIHLYQSLKIEKRNWRSKQHLWSQSLWRLKYLTPDSRDKKENEKVTSCQVQLLEKRLKRIYFFPFTLIWSNATRTWNLGTD